MVSINKITNIVRSVFGKVSKDAIIDYISYLEEIFIIHKLSKMTPSFDEIIRAPFKVIAVDTGLKTITLLSIRTDRASYLETVVANYFTRKGYNVFYGMVDGVEMDLIVETAKGYVPLVIAYEVGEEDTIKREMKNIEKAKIYGKSVAVSRFPTNVMGIKTLGLGIC